MRILALLLVIQVAGPAAAANSSKEFAEEIYGRLMRVTGDGRRAPPLDVIPDGRRSKDQSVAWFDPNSGKIGVEEKTIRLCRSFGDRGDACLAFFLGHELAHFYKDHAWGADFGSRFSVTPLGAGIRELTGQQRLAFETQADDFGGMYAHLAGYDINGIAPDALALVYKEYAIPGASADYPSLAERAAIARNSADRLNRFVPVFEAANLLFAIGRYREAVACLDHVARIFPSREILNNLAIALAIASGARDADRYPWLLDTQTRLHPLRARRGTEAPSEAQRRDMLDSALRNLQDAARRDPEYLPALVNLASVNDVMGRHGTAADDASRALELATKAGSDQAAVPARLARAIAYLHLHRSKEAEADFSAVTGDPAAKYWESIGNGQTAPASTRDAVQKPGPDETVAGRRPDSANPNARTISVEPGLVVRSAGTTQYLELRVSTPAGSLRALLTREYDRPTARGMLRGSGKAAVKEAYGDPSRLHHTASGEWYVYDRTRLVIRFDASGAVDGWTAYAWQE
jgi:tetratricopeptide (TPR) repeat protein